MMKIVALAAALLDGAYMSAVFDHRYARVVDRSPAAVAAVLGDLDIRQIDLPRVLFGSDMPIGDNLPLARSWQCPGPRYR